MATPAPITIPIELIGSIPRPTDLIEGVAKADSGAPNLAPVYENAIRGHHGGVRSHGLSRPFEAPKEVRDRSFEPGKNWRWCQGDGQFLIEARCDRSAWQPDGVQWLP
jgi:hypothetical protein